VDPAQVRVAHVAHAGGESTISTNGSSRRLLEESPHLVGRDLRVRRT
jgi:hypothetical protein